MSTDLENGEPRRTLLVAYWRSTLLPYPLWNLDRESHTNLAAKSSKEDMWMLLDVARTPMPELLQRATSHFFYGDKIIGETSLPSLDLLTTAAEPIGHHKRAYWSLDDQNVLTDVIRCDVLTFSKHKMCVHYFTSGAVDVELSYRFDELEMWKQFRDDADKLLTCFSGN